MTKETAMSIEAQVTQFNETYEIPMALKPTLPTEHQANLCNDLIVEELMELNDAFDNADIVEIADALTDIIYVAAQQAVAWGLPIDALLREVQRSNMSKLGADGLPMYRDDGKVIKGPNFSEPQISTILVQKLDAVNTDFRSNVQ
jgi:predicted HAD superfamily Cof-like phosphohydrolase